MTLPVFFCSMAMAAVFQVDYALAFQLPDTGQTKCWQTQTASVTGKVIDCAHTGQDGEFPLNPMSFTDHGNGTITDNNTGLLWQKCSVGQTDYSACASAPTPYNWYQASGTVNPNNPSSLNVCGSLNLGGHATGWRLPTIWELMSIMDYSVSENGPTIQTIYFPGTASYQYWAADPLITSLGSSQYAYYFFYYIWWSHAYWAGVKTDNHIVKCVYGTHTTRSYTDNGDGTMSDSSTGLMWQQTATPDYMTWDDAISYCNSLSLPTTNGYVDWRLPNIKELTTILDTSQNPSINLTAFPPGDYSLGFWSSTAAVVDTYAGEAYAWIISFANDLGPGPGYFSKGSDAFRYVRCVRRQGFARPVHNGAPGNNYSTIEAAYTAASDGDIIEAQAANFSEDITLSRTIAIALKGGYTSDFLSNPGITTTHSLTIGGSGTVTVENIRIR
jgi:hypothetical protein